MDWWPAWSPDSRRIAFASNRGESHDIWLKDVGGSGKAELVLENVDTNDGPVSWSPDGRWIVFTRFDQNSNPDVWAYDTERGEAVPVVASSFEEYVPVVSPDGRWLAFTSDESGEREVYLTTFPEPARRWQVSTDGGGFPQWRGDGKELFYVTRDGTMMAAELSAAGESMTVGRVRRLFRWNRPAGDITPYTASRDGQRFLVNSSVASTDVTPLTVVLNWDAELDADR
jgi:Tol biopolymer transport system component